MCTETNTKPCEAHVRVSQLRVTFSCVLCRLFFSDLLLMPVLLSCHRFHNITFHIITWMFSFSMGIYYLVSTNRSLKEANDDLKVQLHYVSTVTHVS